MLCDVNYDRYLKMISTDNQILYFTGAIAGIVLACVVLCFVVLAAVFFLYKRRFVYSFICWILSSYLKAQPLETFCQFMLYSWLYKHIKGGIRGTVIARWTTGQQGKRSILRQGHDS